MPQDCHPGLLSGRPYRVLLGYPDVWEQELPSEGVAGLPLLPAAAWVCLIGMARPEALREA